MDVSPLLAYLRGALAARDRIHERYALYTLWTAVVLMLPLGVGLWASSGHQARATTAWLLGLAVAVTVAVIYRFRVVGPKHATSDELLLSKLAGTHPFLARQLRSWHELTRDDSVTAHLAARQLAEQLPKRILTASELVPPRVHHSITTILVVMVVVAIVGLPPMVRGAALLLRGGPAARVTSYVSTPLVMNLRIELVPPAYTGQPPLQLDGASGDVHALAGSRLVLRGTFPTSSTTHTELTLRYEPLTSGVAPLELPIHRDGAQFEVSWLVGEPAAYRFVARTSEREQVEARARNIVVIADRTPTLRLVVADPALEVTTQQEQALQFMAQDDFGVRQIDLVWIHGTQIERVGIPVTPAERIEGIFNWSLAELPRTRDIYYYLEAKDENEIGGPGVARSEVFRLLMKDPNAAHLGTIDSLLRYRQSSLDALAHVLTRTADSPDALETRLQQARQDGAAFAQRVAADARLSKSATSALQELGHSLERPLRTRASATEGLESTVLAIEDWLGRLELTARAVRAAEIDALYEQMSRLAVEYRRNGDPNVLRRMQRLSQQLQREMEALEASAIALRADIRIAFVNADAFPSRVQGDCSLPASGFGAENAEIWLDAVARCRARWQTTTTAWEQATLAHQREAFPERAQVFEQLHAALRHGQREQRELTDNAREIALAQAQRTPPDTVSASVISRYDTELGAVQGLLKNAPAAGLTSVAASEIDTAKDRTAAVRERLTAQDFREAAQWAQLALDAIERARLELNAAMTEEPDSPWNDVTAEAAADLEEASIRLKALQQRLAETRIDPALLANEVEQTQFVTLTQRQARLLEQWRRLWRDPLVQQELGDELLRHSEAAHTAFTKADAIDARERSRLCEASIARALEHLSRVRRDQATPTAGTLRSWRTRADSEPTLQGLSHEGPTQFRADVTEAMKQPPPQGASELVQSYYEEVLR